MGTGGSRGGSSKTLLPTLQFMKAEVKLADNLTTKGLCIAALW